MNILIYVFKLCSLTSHTSLLPLTLPWTFSSTHSRFVHQHLTHPHCPQLFHKHSNLCTQGKFTNISHIPIAINSSTHIFISTFKVCSPTLTHPHCPQLFHEHYHLRIQGYSLTSHTSSLPSTLPWTSSSAHSTLLWTFSCMHSRKVYQHLITLFTLNYSLNILMYALKVL